MKIEIIHNIFREYFPFPYHFSEHGVQRIFQRIIPQDTILLKYLLLSFKRLHLDKIENAKNQFVLIDNKYAFSLLFKKNQNGSLTLITMIRGKESSSFTDCDIFLCSIDKEKNLQETEMIQQYRKKQKSIFN